MEKKLVFKYKNREIQHGGQTLVCGIVNVTPDSFSDGGLFFEVDAAVQRAKDLAEEGCQMIDIGGESTRPGSTPVSVEDEINRIVPVIKRLKAETDLVLSVDTWKADVAEAAIEAGIDIVNDITGLLGDPRMAEVVAASDAGVIAMFNPVIARPEHESSLRFPTFGAEGVFTQDELAQFADMEIIELMRKYFAKSVELAEAAGLPKERIMLDPGIGFGLTKKENYQLVRNLDVIHDWGYCCYLGVSRKRFIFNTMETYGINVDPETEDGFANRDLASSALTAIASFMGIECVRVHVGAVHHVMAIMGSQVRQAEELEDIHFGAYR